MHRAMREKADFPVVTRMIVGFLLALVSCSPRSEERAVEEYPRDPHMLVVSPAGGRLALMLLGDPEATLPMLVIDRSGHVELNTEGSPPAVHADFPMDWLPDGKRLLFWRRTRGPTGWASASSDLLILAAGDSAAESLSDGRGGLQHGLVLEDSTVICRVSGKSVEHPGLYWYRRSRGRWEPDLLLRDTNGQEWVACLWAERHEHHWRVVVKAQEDQGTEFPLTTYWTVNLSRSGQAKQELVATFPELVSGEAISPDGALLAVVRRDSGIRKRLALIPLEPQPGTIKNIGCGKEVLFPTFSPSGEQLLLWSPGIRGDVEAPPPEARVMEVRTSRTRQVPLPDIGPSRAISAVTWLSEDALAIGVTGYGIVTLELSTGRCDTLWRIPSVQ